MYRKYSDGIIEVITGPMYSGKSEELIKRIKILQFANIKTLIVKQKFDTRFSHNEIVSRSGTKLNTIVASNVEEIKKVWNNTYKAIAIDEVQFFDKDIINYIDELASKGIRVIISGLDTDFARKPFGIMPELLAIADDVLKLKAVCFSCKNAGTHTFRITNDKDQKLLGDTESYQARCRKCHLEGEEQKIQMDNLKLNLSL
ncbi:thymidine kinase [[Mycoplasma] mobile]|uniref:Thymidine kinase n=1 Tax=Mycoplasma mobile (strain ATCC 43663 / 163K / NCTC 11711) TaxID=267748 RepID=KITH_MYCM1|nr:thymidine kinase [[Mycoplasma] mobile]Q6KH30.1 RecName: Full=Thymidine kinase [Mycoplasma mobile 163K]AAT28101.1 thymidine kinase [Mycoplasma mobile 163K]